MLEVQKIYHMGIPVNDIDRARDFYTRVLGMGFMDRVGGQLRIDRLTCGPDTVVLFERPKPLERDPIAEDGVAHQAFEMDWNDYDRALEAIQELGLLRTTEDRASGKTVYLFDSEGNHLELHFSTPKEHRAG